MAITKDTKLINQMTSVDLPESIFISFYERTFDPLDVMSHVCSKNPHALIIDDDCLSPDTAQIIKSIKKVNKTIKLIFLTSNSSVDLGRTISPMGMHYYGVKPLELNELEELFKSMNNQSNLHNTFN